jgi:hypothetical protein
MKKHILPFLLSALSLTLGCVADETTEPDQATLDTTRTEVPAVSRAPAVTAVPAHTAQGDTIELASRVDPDVEIARRVAMQLASPASGFITQGCGVGFCLLGGIGGGGHGLPPTDPACGTNTCCIAEDQCGVLTEAACNQFCVQNGMPLPAGWACLSGLTALCICCQP